jgi:anaerobic ribonucleoside-triphosphate reductase activating protein
MKYTDTEVVFREIPDEITLAINISGCPIHCPDCHSKELWKDIGKDLTQRALERMIRENEGITCVAFMGGDADPEVILLLASVIKMKFPGLKVAWYSGRDTIAAHLAHYMCLDYIKTGPFIKERGPLDNPNTNQHLYKKVYLMDGGVKFEDITNKFWKNGEQ